MVDGLCVSILRSKVRAEIAVPRFVGCGFPNPLDDDRSPADSGELVGQSRKPSGGLDFRPRPKAPGFGEPRADDVVRVGLNALPLTARALAHAARFGGRADRQSGDRRGARL
jgi:hypothetical protein